MVIQPTDRIAAVLERERTTDHDVAAFVDVVQGAIGAPAGSWIHYGLTSSDVVDTALCWAMRDAADLVEDFLGRPYSVDSWAAWLQED